MKILMAIVVLSVLVIAIFGSAALMATPVLAKENGSSENGSGKDIKKQMRNQIKDEVKDKIRDQLRERGLKDAESNDSEDINESLSEIDDSVNSSAREAGFAHVFLGKGNVSDGTPARIMWVEKTFSINGSETTNAKGSLKLKEENAFKLSLVSKTNESNELVFNVKTNGKDKRSGTLSLSLDESNNETLLYSGTLTLGNETKDISLLVRETSIRGGLFNVEKSSVTVKTPKKQEISADAESLIDDLKASLIDATSKTGIRITVSNKDGNLTADVKIKGNLTEDEQTIVDNLKDELLDSANSSMKKPIIVDINSNVKGQGFWQKLMFWRKG